jgi:hypothetical protein
MSDPANPASGQPATSQTAPSGSDTSSTPTEGGAPDGREHTALTTGNAPGTTEPGKETTEKTETQATPFDAAKLSFPEELGKPDEGMLNKFAEVAKSLNLTQEGAQQLADLHVEVAKAASEENRKAWSRTIDSWENEIKTDREIGGDKWDGVKANIAKIFNDPRFQTPGFIEALDLTGFGSNPAAARFFAKIASVLTEGNAVQGSPPGQQRPQSAAAALYPNNPSEAR